MQDFASALPGIDEARSFAEVMRYVLCCVVYICVYIVVLCVYVV